MNKPKIEKWSKQSQKDLISMIDPSDKPLVKQFRAFAELTGRTMYSVSSQYWRMRRNKKYKHLQKKEVAAIAPTTEKKVPVRIPFNSMITNLEKKPATQDTKGLLLKGTEIHIPIKSMTIEDGMLKITI